MSRIGRKPTCDFHRAIKKSTTVLFRQKYKRTAVNEPERG